MSGNHQCTLCQKTKDGRFTRRKISTGNGWSQGLQLPQWYCFQCLPLGEGRDEDASMPAAKSDSLVPAGKAKTEASVELGKIQRGLPSLESEVKEMTITDEEGYLYADTLLKSIRDTRKGWKGVWDRIQERTIKPIRAGLDELYGLNRDADGPLERVEEALKAKMKTFKLAEMRKLQAAEDARNRETERLRREAEDKARAAEQAKTPQMRGKLEAQAQRAEQAALEVEQEERPEPVRAVSSTVRPKQKVRVIDAAAFFKGIVEGYVPVECGCVAQKILEDHFKADPEGMKAWPGVEVYDDVQIVGR